MEEKRPDPNEFLEQARQEEGESPNPGHKGKLKVFLGYCAGVGKTYRMLQEAQAAHKNGISVAVAVVETHGRKETEALLTGLTVLPRKKIEYSGITLEELDIDLALSGRPSLALVDELAHTNAPGSRHAKRYQDVDELLKAGINVYTTINIQHIESMIDLVQQVSGVRITETVPDGLLAQADEIELVDLTPEKLIERLRDGKVYIPRKAEQAMHQFFKKGNLLALRELSLKYTAKQVDEDMRGYMIKNAVSGPWPVGARLLTGMSPSPSSQRLIRFTHRMAQDLDAEWYAVFVESPQQIEMNEKDRLQLDKNIRLAEELGAIFVILKGINLAEELLNFSRGKNVTLIVVGPSKRNLLERLLKGSVLDRLIRDSGAISVLVAGSEKQNSQKNENKFRRKTATKAYALSFLGVAATTIIGILLRPSLEPLNIAMILLLPAIASGVFGGMRAGLFASVAAVCALDFFFIPPYLTFRVTDIRYLPAFAVFIFVSLVASYLAKSVRQEAETSLHRERFVYSLYAFTKVIMAARGLDDILERAVKNIYEAFEYNVSIFLPDQAGGLVLSARNDDKLFLSDTEKAVAVWVYNNGRPAGRGTNTLSSSAWYFLPLKVQDKIIGTIGLRSSDEQKFLTPDQNQLFESFAGVAALAIIKASK
jgi:two-component system, OmpR family, sensor histidine kinase KdpD